MGLTHTFTSLGIALGIGLLIGMQRERVQSKRAGARTFPLIALLGGVCGMLTEQLGVWIVVAGLLGVVAAFLASNLSTMHERSGDSGTTTEIAMLVTFALGALAILGPHEVVLAVGGVVFVLLYVKEPLHAFVRQIGEKDVLAIVQFALISLVVLPVLPNRTFGPYDVLNPHRIWLLVVLVVAIGLVGYVARKLLGDRRGAIVNGVFGGMVSSTATTASVGRQARGVPKVGVYVLILAIASAMVQPRQLVEIAAVAPDTFETFAGPIVVLFLAMLPSVVLALHLVSRQEVELPEPSNPAGLRPAILFGLVFAAVLLGVAIAQDEFGDRGMYVVSLFAGLTDVDAITLSTAGLVSDGRVDPTTGWRAVVLASLVNLAFKLGVAGVLGGRNLLRGTALAFGPGFAAGGLLLAFW